MKLKKVPKKLWMIYNRHYQSQTVNGHHSVYETEQRVEGGPNEGYQFPVYAIDVEKFRTDIMLSLCVGPLSMLKERIDATILEHFGEPVKNDLQSSCEGKITK